MLLGAGCFAVMAALAHALHRDLDWRTIALVRSLVPLVLTGGAAAAAGVRLVFWRPRTLWVRSLAGSASLVGAFYALTHLPVADALTLTNLYPVWIALLSWPLLGLPPSAGAWVAIVTGLAGVVLIQQPHFADGNFATLAALGSSLAAAVAMLGLHRLRTVDVRAIVFHFSAVSCLVCLATLLTDRHEVVPSVPAAAVWGMLLATGVAATGGQVCITLAFAAGAPARVSVVGLTQIGFGMLFDVLFWGRHFEAVSLCGILLVTAPTAWLLMQPGRRSAECGVRNKTAAARFPMNSDAQRR